MSNRRTEQNSEVKRVFVTYFTSLHCFPNRAVEVQSGSYLGEDDIVRFTDIYGRVKSQEVIDPQA